MVGTLPGFPAVEWDKRRVLPGGLRLQKNDDTTNLFDDFRSGLSRMLDSGR